MVQPLEPRCEQRSLDRSRRHYYISLTQTTGKPVVRNFQVVIWEDRLWNKKSLQWHHPSIAILNQSDEPLDVEKVTLKDFLLVNHCAYGRSRLVEPPRNQESSVDILEIGVNTFSPHKRSRLEPAMESVSQTSDKGRTKAKNSGLDTLAAVVGLQKLSYTSEAKETHDSSPPTTVDDFESEKVVRQIELIKYFRRQCLALQSRFQLLQQQHIALQEQYRVHFGGKSLDLNPGFARDLSSISSIKAGTSSK